MKRDGHIHTPFCPHGSSDPFELYIEKAIANGFEEITFTEHAPLPASFVDLTPEQDSGMNTAQLHNYFEQLQRLKETYKAQIKINIGLEIDYIVGYETETRQFLNEFGTFLDDAILSVHFLKHGDNYYCIDFSEEVYLYFAKQVGGIQAMYNQYYQTVQMSIQADLGPFKPKRIGHPTLIHKFQLAHALQIDDKTQIEALFIQMVENGYELDLNSAGLSKPLCKEPYPPLDFVAFAQVIKLPIVFGSDAHTANDLHQHYNEISQKFNL
ncbi:histidinol-phosphatase HisJ [Solibacillus cecembensis]|uniref:histidinol-phosphatase HisJ n=1 Tax=Solibacillus cecembensis TaxID=459347 RepID=UPI003D06057F